MTVTRRWLLPFETLAPSLARDHVAALVGERADDAALVVSELVGNAIRHAHPPVELQLSMSSTHLRIEVTASHHPGDPTPVERAVLDATGGAGLRLVRASADAWDWELIGRRLTVHADLSIS